MNEDAPISKVSVEYHDPSSVFAYVEKQLASHLPLRNVHWKSPTRPLRCIDTLHIEFVATSDFNRPGPGQEQPRADFGPPAHASGERRHQIPGLRQTPYLRIFFLRCDDYETYKTTGRKALREWLNTYTLPLQSSSSKSSQENHDAFEWLIVHVVYPNMTAASQSRTGVSSSKIDDVNGEKARAPGKLLGRRSSTILEKIRADFNVPGKSAPDRVEQIHLRADGSPSDEISERSSRRSGDWTESGHDHNRSWQDLVSKLTTLILTSFNLRVSQYEDNIVERNSQRALPGWNFCTFFMLKEGLLRGFESVGLVEDALIGYDELSLDLDNALQDENGDRTAKRSDSFLKYTKEMKDILVQSLASGHPSDVVWQRGFQVISVSRKDYRNLIVNSNVSRLDLQSYIFARQMSILLRMSTPDMSDPAHRSTFRDTTRGTKQLSALSELCHRTTLFILEASRTLKVELREAAKAQGIACPESIIDNIVASFSFATAEQILLATNVSKSNINKSFGARQAQVLERSQHTERRSSIPARNVQQYQHDHPLALLEYLGVRSDITHRPDDDLHVAQPSDMELLAGHRSDLLLLQRHIMETFAFQKGWSAGASQIQSEPTTDTATFANFGLAKQPDDHKALKQSESSSRLQGVLYSSLLEGLSTSDEFSMFYETLTNLCLVQCVLAYRLRTAEKLCADLAVLRYDAGDYITALTYLSKIVPIYTNGDWTFMEEGLTNIYLQCLKSLNQNETYVRMALGMLSKSAHRRKSELVLSQRGSALVSRVLPEQDDTRQLMDDLLETSRLLPSNIVVAISDLFANTTIDPYIQHFKDQDGITVRLKARFLLGCGLVADCVRLKLQSIEPPFRDLWLESGKPIPIISGNNVVELRSNTTCSGLFSVEKIILISKKLSFETGVRSILSRTLAEAGAPRREQNESVPDHFPNVLCFPSHKNIAVDIYAARDVYIGKTKLLEIRLRTNRNSVKSAQITLRAASAGLRLMTADAFVSIPGSDLVKAKEPGMIKLTSLEACSSITVSLPYDLESNLHEIMISLDCQYTTSSGTFRYMSKQSVVVDLALDIGVHDLFKRHMLFSRFQIRASKGLPLLVSSVDLLGTDRFAVKAPPRGLAPMLIVPQQDGIVVYKIHSKNQEQMERQSVEQELPLQLHVRYQLLDEKVLALMQHALRRALRQSRFANFTLLVCQALPRVVSELHPIQLSKIALLNEFRTPRFDQMGWNELLNGLEPALRQGLTIWLRDWHEQNRVFQLASHQLDIHDAQEHVRSLRIDVPIPRLHVLSTVEMSLPFRDPVSQGTAITATVSVYHTRRWEIPILLAGVTRPESNEPEFSLEVDAPADMWLLGGDRRVGFVLSERYVKTFDVSLVPLKVGQLLLPKINVRWGGQGNEVRCETDYRSAGETVEVVADVKSETVGMSEMFAGSEVILVGSERHCS